MAKVLIVDDSALMRRVLSELLSEAGHQVHTARNGSEGVEALLAWQPDVVTLDVNMPVMDGLTALSLMMAARPTPVVMLSSLTEAGTLATLEALALGAVDHIAKPQGTISLNLADVEGLLLQKIEHALQAHPRAAQRHAPTPGLPPAIGPTAARKPARPRTEERSGDPPLVLIGVSTGGPRTLEDILPHLPATLPGAVVVAQHMPANFTSAFAQRMARMCPMPVQEVDVTMPLSAGHIYIGKGGTDVTVGRRLGRLVALPRPEAPDHLWHPSVTALTESALQCVPPQRLTGVMLTGMGDDGAQAMTRLKQLGGRTIAESQATAVVFGMPGELIARGGASVVLPCQHIARQIKTWLTRSPTKDGHGLAQSI